MYYTINVDNISSKGYYYEKNLEIDGTRPVDDNDWFLSNAEVKINFFKKGKEILARGKIKTNVSLSCVRCLEVFDLKINSSFDIILYPIEGITDFDTNLSSNDMEYIFYRDQKIDIREIVLDQVNLLIPFKPLCKEDCKGICTRCGTNLNNGKCLCKREGN
jgi:uncharacterized protein